MVRELLYYEKNGNLYRYRLIECPEYLKSKVVALKFFRENLRAPSSVALAYSPTYIQSQMVYVKKWVKLDNATMFRLSNKLVQVVFDDRTEILFDINRKQIIYTGYSEHKSLYALSAVLESGNTDLIKRFKYTKEILSQMYSSVAKLHKGTLN